MNIFLHMLNIDLENEDASPSANRVPEIAQYGHQANTSEGSEFLDDAIRMADQPFYPSDKA